MASIPSLTSSRARHRARTSRATIERWEGAGLWTLYAVGVLVMFAVSFTPATAGIWLGALIAVSLLWMAAWVVAVFR